MFCPFSKVNDLLTAGGVVIDRAILDFIDNMYTGPISLSPQKLGHFKIITHSNWTNISVFVVVY